MISKILIVDDDTDAALSLSRALKANSSLDLEMSLASNEEKALLLASELKQQVAILDLCLVESVGVESGFSLLLKMKKIIPQASILMLTGHGAKENGIRSLQNGASSFLEKPADINHLAILVEDGIKQCKFRRSYSQLEKSYSNTWKIVGQSKASRVLREQITFASSTKQSVLLEGETGTGKTYCAKMIHALSAQQTGSFIAYQATHGSSDIVSSDLFGHLKGSFTGATEDRRGLIESADNGTLFLDEVDELPKETQVSLLTVLQEKKIRMLGSSDEKQVDFRLICASNANLEKTCDEGKLRKDLFHRIAHLRIQLPSLRDRLEDINDLVNVIISDLSVKEDLVINSVSTGAILRLKNYNWPGNIRELYAVIENAAYLARYKGRFEILDEDIQINSKQASKSQAVNFHSNVKNYKKKLVAQALEESSNNQVQAAKLLGIDRSTLRRILES